MSSAANFQLHFKGLIYYKLHIFPKKYIFTLHQTLGKRQYSLSEDGFGIILFVAKSDSLTLLYLPIQASLKIIKPLILLMDQIFHTFVHLRYVQITLYYWMQNILITKPLKLCIYDYEHGMTSSNGIYHFSNGILHFSNGMEFNTLVFSSL